MQNRSFAVVRICAWYVLQVKILWQE